MSDLENWATKRLNELVGGAAPPPVVQTLQLAANSSMCGQSFEAPLAS